MKKRCPRCGETKDLLTEFRRRRPPKRIKNPVPGGIYPRPWCKACEDEFKEAWKRKNSERWKEIQRGASARYRAKVKADPERHALALETERRRHRKRTGTTVTKPGAWKYQDTRRRLPAGPFVAWLERKVREHGRAEFARRLGIHERNISRYLSQDEIDFETVDRLLTLDGKTHLSELYPELYRNN